MPSPRAIPIAALAFAALAVSAGVALAAPGDLSIVSRSSAGALGASAADAAAVSADGRYVAFTSAAALTATGTGGKVQLYVRDRTAGTTALASASAAGAAANADVETESAGNILFAISGGGRYVVFSSASTNLTGADTDATLDVYRKDMTTGAVALISVNTAGAKANAAVGGDPDVSGDGNRVSFGSGLATNLISPDGNGNASDVLVRDVAAGTTTLVAQTTAGVQANGITERSAMSADGRAVAFEAPNTTDNLAPNDTGAGNDIFVRNLAAGTLSAVSDPSAATGSSFPDISGDGRYAVIETANKYDPTNDVSLGNDVYRRDLGTGAIVLVSAKNASDVAGATNGIRPSISADGGLVAFTSASTDLTTDANAATTDVFVRDIAARSTRLASVRANGTTQGTTDSERSAISPNGGLVAFSFNDAGAATKLVTDDANNQPDIHAKEFAPGDATGPALTLTGPAEGATETTDRIAVGGAATDPSGIVTVTVDGTPVSLTASGGFSTTVPAAVGANTVTVRALDGSGNTTTLTRTVTRAGASAAPPKTRARLLGLSAVLKANGALVVKVRLSAGARVRVRLLRRTVGGAAHRIVLHTVGAPVTRTLKAGRRTVTLSPPRLRAGRYVVRVSILSAATGPTTRNILLRVKPVATA